MDFKKIRGQGTIEYLVIIAIVVVIALVVVSLLLGLSSPGQQVSSTSGNISATSGRVALTEKVIGRDGNSVFVIKNNTGETMTLNQIKMGSTYYDLPAVSIPAGGSIAVSPTGLPACTTNQTYDTSILYNSANNLPNTIQLGSLTYPCEDTATAATVANVGGSTGGTTPSGTVANAGFIWTGSDWGTPAVGVVYATSTPTVCFSGTTCTAGDAGSITGTGNDIQFNTN